MPKPVGFQGRRFLLKASSPIQRDQTAPGSPWWMLAGLTLLILCTFLPGLGTDLKYHWASSGLLALCGCLLAARLPRPWILPGLLLWFTALGTVTLLALWQSGLSDGFTLAGLFPYSDAAGYFNDAQRILAGEPITSFSSRRPLYAAFLAGLLKTTGNNLRLALWLQTLVVSCSLGWVTWGMLRRTGRVANAVVFGMTMWLFFRRFIGTTTTENLGLLLGALGFLAIWEALHERSIRLFTLGLFLTGLALNARAGAFFVLPTLLLWGSLYFAKEGQRFSRWALGMGALALLLSFGFNYGALVLSGGRPGLAFSNFSYTLYGLVHGGNWQLALAQHPELSLLEPGRQAASVFHLAWRQIEAHPFSLIEGAFRAWVTFLPRAFLFVESPHPWVPSALASRLFALLALRALFIVWQSRSTAAFRLMLAYLTGILLSVPFAPPWDSDYMRIFAATIPALCWLASTGVQMGTKIEIAKWPPEPSAALQRLLLASGGFFLLLVLPHLRGAATEAKHLQAVPGSLLRVDPGLTGSGSPHPTPSMGVRKSLRALLRERRLPPIPLDQLLENAHPKISPEGIRSFLKALPQGEPLSLVLATGNAWPTLSGYDTNLIVIQGSSAWAFDARGPQRLGAVTPPALP